MFQTTKLVAIGSSLVLAMSGVAVFAQSSVPELPPNAKAGECYAKVMSPTTYKSENQKVLKKEATERIEIIPAKYEWVEEKVLVKEAYEKLAVVPAEYKWVEEKVQVSPASKTVKEVPATFDWVEEKVLVKPAQTVWKKGSGLAEKVDNATGEIMCRVEEPAVYKTVKKRVQKTPAKTSVNEIPAKYTVVKKQVLVKPESTKKTMIPAKYTTMKVKKLVTASQEKRIPIPAEYLEVTKQVKVTDGKLVWKPVLCQTNMGPELVHSIQRALKTAGHDPGAIDGVIGGQTMQAVYSFQKAKGLSQGALTMDTLKALNVTVTR